MRALDRNVLVYALVPGTERRERARHALTEHAEGTRPWALPCPCAYEFLRVVTHPAIFESPMPIDRAASWLQRILDSPSLSLLSESGRHPAIMRELLEESGATRNLVHDAQIAALCLEHGVREIMTGDTEFHRFPTLDVVDPLQP